MLARLASWLGTGLLVGSVVGAAAGLREVLFGHYIEHGTWWLAADELCPRVLAGAAWGGAVAIALALAGSVLLGLLPPLRAGTTPAPGGLLRLLARVGLVVALVAVAATLALPSLRRARAAGRPSVILVSFDTLRADRLGIMGNPRPLTPHLDRFGREGTVFEQAHAPAPWTLPSHVSLFASLLPFDHGVRHVGSRIPPGLMLLAEGFRDAGYRTGAFTGGGYVSWGYGFDQGFEIYRDHEERAEGGPHRIAAEALEWVRSLDGEPFFLFVHTYEPHHPYAHDDFADPADAGRLTVDYNSPDGTRVEAPLTEAERRYAFGLYDSGVAHADRVVGGMLEELRPEGVLDRAILVVLSDHGEDCWDHDAEDIPRHGHTLYQELLHVPLLVRAPGLVPAGARIRTPVSLLDVAPTLLELAGLPTPSAFRGNSLASTCRSGVEPEPRAIHSESTRYGPDRVGMRDGDLKVVITPRPERFHEERIEAKPLEIFDLARDPEERVNRVELAASAASGMVSELKDRASVHLSADEAEAEGAPPDALMEQLRSLGYVD